MISRIVMFVGLTLALLLAGLPASLMDRVIATATDGRLRLAAAEGSFWRGHGVLAIADGQRRLNSSRAVGWRVGVDPSRSGLTLLISEHGHDQALLLFTLDGAQLEGLNLDMPLEAVSAAIDHPATRAGWRGTLALEASDLSCDWRATCNGTLRVRWSDAGLDIVPERHLGDHEILVHAHAGAFDVVLKTLDGDLRLDGRGTIDRDGRVSLQAMLSGDPEIVDRLPNIMDHNARLTATPGQVAISWP
jgi:hypothetical protein